MKKLLLPLGLSAALLIGAGTNPVPVMLEWDTPTTDNYTNLLYRLYGTTNLSLSMSNWPMISVVTNPIPTNNGAQLFFSIPIVPGAWFFTMTASNFWGESPFSNVAPTPPVPALLNNLRISR